jgi:hypothetical protein
MNLEDDIVYLITSWYLFHFVYWQWSLNGFAHFSKRVKNDYFHKSLKFIVKKLFRQNNKSDYANWNAL